MLHDFFTTTNLSTGPIVVAFTASIFLEDSTHSGSESFRVTVIKSVPLWALAAKTDSVLPCSCNNLQVVP